MKRLFTLAILLLTIFSAQAQWKAIPVTITSGDSLSSAGIIPAGYVLFGAVLPALTEGSVTLTLDVEGQQNGATFKPLWFDGALYSETIDSTGGAFTLDTKALYGWQIFRIVLPVTQEADKTIYLQAIKF